MRFQNWKKPKYLLIVFLCAEILALCLGGKAFYADPAMTSIGESAPYYDLTPILPPQGWSTQQQWFTADGDLFSRIIFSVAADGEGTGGFTVNVRDEAGEAVISEHYAAEGLSEGLFTLDIQKTVKYGGRYCFEIVADEDGAGWSVPYLYVPGGELSWLEEASVDGVPMGGGLHYMFLSLYYARLNYVAIFLHVLAAIAGIAYFCLLHFTKEKKMLAADIAVLCAAGACTAGQFFLCKNYYFSRTLLLCLPGIFLLGLSLLHIVGWDFVKAHLRELIRSWKNWVRKNWAFLGAVLLAGIMFSLSITKERFSSSDFLYFYISAAAFLAFLFLGIFSIPKLNRIFAKCPWLVYGIESGLIFLHMEISNANPFTNLKLKLAIWNIVTIFSVLAVLWALFGNFRRAGIAGTALFAVWGIANYLTVDFRGIPIAPNDLMSAGTALKVLGSYQLKINIRLTALLVLVFLEILLLFRLPAKAGKEKRLWSRSAVAVCTAVFLWQGYFGSLNPLSMSGWQWKWQLGYYPQGYIAISIGKIQQLFTAVPAEYSSEAVQALCAAQGQKTAAAQTEGDQRPNIILILNESWFDWRQITEFETDRQVMPFIDSLENCIKGYTVGPYERGGTSLSEYELLTSNSLSMMSEVTPFTQRNLEGSYSVVSYLEALDYTTAAIHPSSANNYNRRVAYPQLGFDGFYFSDDEFFKDSQNIHGYISDSDAFRAVKTVFEEKDTDAPALVYLLTIQNHSGYDATEKVDGVRSSGLEEYTVNLESGFDGEENAAEEYLSLVRCTDAAFEELLGYFEDCDEPTIVCMVGDHAPPLGWGVQSSYEGYEWSMRQRGTPFVIWANYPIESENVGYIGMVQLVPLLMETAGLPLSPYYQTILDLGEEYPVLSAAFYQDADGNFGNYSYTEEVPQSELLRQYFYFEYNSLLAKEKRIADIFLPG